uniref:Uncharacterized protein n=1 Tax=Bionectria ochroleuca TaxID=29856 RepID=A0A0B7K5J2_BIOOC
MNDASYDDDNSPAPISVGLYGLRRDLDSRVAARPLLIFGQGRLLLANALEYIGIPPLAHVRMALDPIPQSGLAQRLGSTPRPKGELHIVQPATVAFDNPPPLLLDPVGDGANADLLQLVKVRVQVHPLKEWDREPRARARRGRQDAMRRRDAHALGQRLEALADGHHHRPRDRRTVDPLPLDVLHL